MSGTHCPSPLAFADAVDYWSGDLAPADEARIDEHTFACDACARELAAAGTLAGGIVAAVRDGRLHGIVSDAILNRLAADGVRVRMFTLEGSGVVPCAVWAGDDLVVSRLRADFSDIDAVTIVTRLPSGEELSRLTDVTVRPGQHEILNAFSAAHLRKLPATRVHVTVTGRRGGGDRTVAEYTLEHGGSFERPAGGR
jgi:hypothetical protein